MEDDNLLPSPIEIILSRINEFDDDTPYPLNILACLRLLLRTIPWIYIRTPEHLAQQCGIKNVAVFERYPNLADKNLLPPERSGQSPPELKHLARCCIRQCLFENWALPHGIRELEIPQSLMDYLDLMSD